MADFSGLYSDTEITYDKSILIPLDDNTKYTIKEYRQKL